MSSKKELRQLQRVAEALGKLFADERIKTERQLQRVAEAQANERIKTERLMAEEKRKEIRKVLWSLSLDLDPRL